MRRWSKGNLEVLEIGASHVLLHPDGCVLVDCSDGVATLWEAMELPRQGPDAIVFTSGASRRVSGVYAFLSLLSGSPREKPLTLLLALANERLPSLVAAWAQAEPSLGFPLEIEAEHPGADLEVGPFRLRSFSVQHPNWGLAWRVDVEERVVAFAGEAMPGPGVEKACKGAELCVLAGDHHRVEPDLTLWACAPWRER
jgi:ribonuclease BN (tRNA processing enzyme)